MVLRFYKKTDNRNSVSIPKQINEKFGKEYYMEVYEDKIVLIPVKKEN